MSLVCAQLIAAQCYEHGEVSQTKQSEATEDTHNPNR